MSRKQVYALVDCNNFFVSCERVFNPKARNLPTVVLSNNDGCIIARSQEVKDLGIKMGEPYFKCKKLLERNNVQVFSTNFYLYGDISRRVLNVLHNFAPNIEPYSIDESFLILSDLNINDYEKYAREIKKTIRKWLDIPVSIGIAYTKSLSKVANKLAKSNSVYEGVVDLTKFQDTQLNQILRKYPIDEIWGIGRKLSMYFHKMGINDAYQLRSCDRVWAKQKLSTPVLRIIDELNNLPKIKFKEMRNDKKGISSTRSFGKYVESLQHLEESVSMHIAIASRKLRKQGSVASNIIVFIKTNKHIKAQPYYKNMCIIPLPTPTNYPPTLTKYALIGVRNIYKQGYKYIKAGVHLVGIIPKNATLNNLFMSKSNQNNVNERVITEAIDKTNKKYGAPVIKLLSEGIDYSWRSKRKMLSQNYVSNWDDLLQVK